MLSCGKCGEGLPQKNHLGLRDMLPQPQVSYGQVMPQSVESFEARRGPFVRDNGEAGGRGGGFPNVPSQSVDSRSHTSWKSVDEAVGWPPVVRAQVSWVLQWAHLCLRMPTRVITQNKTALKGLPKPMQIRIYVRSGLSLASLQVHRLIAAHLCLSFVKIPRNAEGSLLVRFPGNKLGPRGACMRHIALLALGYRPFEKQKSIEAQSLMWAFLQN